jgi:hypothetical protein
MSRLLRRAALLAATALAVLPPAAPETASGGDLPVLPNAVEVVRHTKGKTPFVAYDVRETYPARRTIEALVDAMARAGWRLAEVGGFKGSWPQPSDFPRAPGPWRNEPTHVWRGRWLGADGREVAFRLTYSCPMEDVGMHSVWVQVSGDAYGPQEAAARKAARHRILRECEAGRMTSPECER